MSDSVEVKWEVSRVEWDTETGGVTSVRWDVVVSDGEITVKAPGTSKFDPDPSSNLFIPLDGLDESTVLSWVQSSLIDYKETELRAVERYNRKKRIPSTSYGIPWQSA